jgi:hypothetical protein
MSVNKEEHQESKTGPGVSKQKFHTSARNSAPGGEDGQAYSGSKSTGDTMSEARKPKDTNVQGDQNSHLKHKQPGQAEGGAGNVSVLAAIAVRRLIANGLVFYNLLLRPDQLPISHRSPDQVKPLTTSAPTQLQSVKHSSIPVQGGALRGKMERRTVGPRRQETPSRMRERKRTLKATRIVRLAV